MSAPYQLHIININCEKIFLQFLISEEIFVNFEYSIADFSLLKISQLLISLFW